MALKGIKVVELAGLAPAPFCGMILADFGASIIRVDKSPPGMDVDCLGNGKRSLLLNLKSEKGVEILKKLSNNADVLIEPFRPGIMEKLGLGPDVLMAENKKLIYARLSGYGQKGPFAEKAGHDINYLAVSGILSMIGGCHKMPTPPANFAADFAGGGLLCALGIVMALHERNTSGRGQVIDADMTSGVAYVGSWLFRSLTLPLWSGPRGTNILDGGSHYYCCYETKDSKYMAVGAIEPQFYERFMEALSLSSDEYPQFGDNQLAKSRIQEVFKKQPQKHWIEVFNKADACVTPVFEIDEAADVYRDRFVRCNENIFAPIPAPKLSRTPGETQANKPRISQGEHTVEILKEAGYSDREIQKLVENNVISSPSKL